MALADFPQALDERNILRQPRLLELNVATSPVAVRQTRRALPRHRSGQQAGGHGRIDNHAKSYRSAVRQNLLLNFATN